jgi:hypothetical protein
MTIYYDDFTRTVSNGWGTPSGVGTGSYTLSSGSVSSYSVNGTRGLLNIPASGTRAAMLLTPSASDAFHRCIFNLPALPQTTTTTSRVEIQLGLRVIRPSTDPNGLMAYRAVALVQSDGVLKIQIEKWTVPNGTAAASVSATASVRTTLGTGPYIITGITMAAATDYYYVFDVRGFNPTTLHAKIWEKGTIEPAAWQVTEVDSPSLSTDGSSYLQVPGGGWIGAFASSTNSVNVNIQFDNAEINTAPYSPLSSVGMQLRTTKVVNGVATQVGTDVDIPAVSVLNGGTYWLKVDVSGPTVKARVWQDGDTEPVSWLDTETISDSALQVSGDVGVRTLIGTGTTNAAISVSVDDLTITDNSTPIVQTVTIGGINIPVLIDPGLVVTGTVPPRTVVVGGLTSSVVMGAISLIRTIPPTIGFYLSSVLATAGNSFSIIDFTFSRGKYISTTEITSGLVNNLFSTVTPTQVLTGYTDYRAFFIRNISATDTLTGATLTADVSRYGGLYEFGIETPPTISSYTSTSPQGGEISDVTTPPATVTFADRSTPLSLGSLGPNQVLMVWVKRFIPVGTPSTASDYVDVYIDSNSLATPKKLRIVSQIDAVSVAAPPPLLVTSATNPVKTFNAYLLVAWDGANYVDESDRLITAGGLYDMDETTHQINSADASITLDNNDDRYTQSNRSSDLYYSLRKNKQPVLLVGGYNGQINDIFTGRIDKVSPPTGRDAQVHVVDTSYRLRSVNVSYGPVFDLRTDDIIRGILANAGLVENTDFFLDIGDVYIPYALVSKGDVITEIQKVAQVEGGRIFIQYGIIYFWNRTHTLRARKQPLAQVPLRRNMYEVTHGISPLGVYNRVTYNWETKTPDTPTTMFTINPQHPELLEGGGKIEHHITDTYDQFGAKVSVADADWFVAGPEVVLKIEGLNPHTQSTIVPTTFSAAATTTKATRNADGTGATIPVVYGKPVPGNNSNDDSLHYWLDLHPTYAYLHLSFNGLGSVYLHQMDIQGTPQLDTAQRSTTAADPDADPDEEAELVLSNNYEPDSSTAMDRAREDLARRLSPLFVLNSATQDAMSFLRAGDVIRVIDDAVTGQTPDVVDVEVLRNEWNISSEGFTQSLQLSSVLSNTFASVGAAGTPDVSDTGVRFDGVTGLLNIFNNDALALGANMTIEFWMKLGPLGQARVVFSKGTNWPRVGVSTTGQLNVRNGLTSLFTTASSLTVTDWHHVVVTASTGSVSLYVDGLLAGTAVATFADNINDLITGGSPDARVFDSYTSVDAGYASYAASGITHTVPATAPASSSTATVLLIGYEAGVTVASVTGLGATWTRVAGPSGGGNARGEVWIGTSPNLSSTDITVNYSANAYASYQVVRYNDISSTVTVTTASGGLTTGLSPTRTVSVTPGTSNNVVLTVAMSDRRPESVTSSAPSLVVLGTTQDSFYVTASAGVVYMESAWVQTLDTNPVSASWKFTTNAFDTASGAIFLISFNHSNPSGIGDLFNGSLDEFAIYNRPLNETEILDHYSLRDSFRYSTEIADTLGLVARYRLGETSGTTAYDYAQGHDGTYVGGVALGVPGALRGIASISHIGVSTGGAVLQSFDAGGGGSNFTGTPGIASSGATEGIVVLRSNSVTGTPTVIGYGKAEYTSAGIFNMPTPNIPGRTPVTAASFTDDGIVLIAMYFTIPRTTFPTQPNTVFEVCHSSDNRLFVYGYMMATPDTAPVLSLNVGAPTSSPCVVTTVAVQGIDLAYPIDYEAMYTPAASSSYTINRVDPVSNSAITFGIFASPTYTNWAITTSTGSTVTPFLVTPLGGATSAGSLAMAYSIQKGGSWQDATAKVVATTPTSTSMTTWRGFMPGTPFGALVTGPAVYGNGVTALEVVEIHRTTGNTNSLSVPRPVTDHSIAASGQTFLMAVRTTANVTTPSGWKLVRHSGNLTIYERVPAISETGSDTLAMDATASIDVLSLQIKGVAQQVYADATQSHTGTSGAVRSMFNESAYDTLGMQHAIPTLDPEGSLFREIAFWSAPDNTAITIPSGWTSGFNQSQNPDATVWTAISSASETILPGCNVYTESSTSVSIDVDVNVAFPIGTVGHQVILRVRRGGLGGTVLGSNTVTITSGDTANTTGDAHNWATTIVDATPGTYYVLTAQYVTTTSNNLVSNRRRVTLTPTGATVASPNIRFGSREPTPRNFTTSTLVTDLNTYRFGTSSVFMTAGPGDTIYRESPVHAALDIMTGFSVDDRIEVFVRVDHRDRLDSSSEAIRLVSQSGSYFYVTYDIIETYHGLILEDRQWARVEIPKSAWISVGAPVWSYIVQEGIIVHANSLGDVTVWFDAFTHVPATPSSTYVSSSELKKVAITDDEDLGSGIHRASTTFPSQNTIGTIRQIAAYHDDGRSLTAFVNLTDPIEKTQLIPLTVEFTIHP